MLTVNHLKISFLLLLAVLVSGIASWSCSAAPSEFAEQSMPPRVAREFVLTELKTFETGFPPVLQYSDSGWQEIERITISSLNMVISTNKRSSPIVFRLKDLDVRAKHTFLPMVYDTIYLNDKQTLRVHHRNYTKIAEALAVLKQEAIKIEASIDEPGFGEVVRTYHDEVTKPTLSEEVRRYKVQAEFAIRDKNFDDAIDLYARALKLAPWWPEGRFNRALLLGETNDYELAALEMRRYLLLLPNASDAQAAQDKIYYWERKANTPN